MEGNVHIAKGYVARYNDSVVFKLS